MTGRDFNLIGKELGDRLDKKDNIKYVKPAKEKKEESKAMSRLVVVPPFSESKCWYMR